MPSKSKDQERFMRMCAHESGRKWAKEHGVKCAPRKVAKEFVRADKKKGK
jgi:hypothetical protein